MAQAIRVAGPTGIQINGASFGFSENGVDLALNLFDEVVIADTGGPRIPVDIQDFGMDCTIRARMVVYDDAILRQLMSRSNAQGEGKLGSPGRLLGAGGHTFVLRLANDEPWKFPTAILRGSARVTAGSRRNLWDVEFYAWALIGNGSTALNVPLYTRE